MSKHLRTRSAPRGGNPGPVLLKKAPALSQHAPMKTFIVASGESWTGIDLRAAFLGDLARLPVVLRIMAENALRNGEPGASTSIIANIRGWLAGGASEAELQVLPNRIMMHDTTCGPALVDIAAMRDVLAERGLDPRSLSPRIRVDVSTDHSSAVDVFARPDAVARNLEHEVQRNSERYRLMKWAGKALPGITVHPPGSGIMHTINPAP